MRLSGAVIRLLSLWVLLGCSKSTVPDTTSAQLTVSKTYSSIYWSDGDSGKIGEIKFRLANIDAPETGSMKQRGGAKCELERELGYDAKAYMVEFTKDKTISMVRDYGKDRYGRLVVDLEADGSDVAKAGVNAGHLKDWLHIKGRAQYAKPDWCSKSEN